MILSFNQLITLSFGKHLVNIYNVLSTVLGTGDRRVN